MKIVKKFGAKNHRKQRKLHLASLNKWSMSFAVTLVILSAYMGIAKVSQNQNDEILYVLDTVPTEITSVSGTLNPADIGITDGNTEDATSKDGAVANSEVGTDGENPEVGNNAENVAENVAETSSDLGDILNILFDNLIEETDEKSDNENTDIASDNTDNTENTDNTNNTNETSTEKTSGTAVGDPISNVADPSSYAISDDSDFFINYRLEREKNRSEQLELLNAIIAEDNTEAQMRSQTQEKIVAITEAMENELLLENILVAKYGGEAVVFVQTEKINVVLSGDTGKMSANEAAKIAEMVNGYTDIGFENVIVVIKS